MARARGTRNWIQKAINPRNKGALRRTLGAKAGKNIPVAALKKATTAKATERAPKTAARARLALKLRSFHR